MDRAPFFTQGNLRQFLACALAGAALFAAHTSARAAAADGLAISGSPRHNATEGLRWSFTPSVADPSRRSLSFKVANPPPWATLNTSTGQLSGTPPVAAVGRTYNVTLTVRDGVDAASLWFQIVVYPDVPVISGKPPTSVAAGSAYSFQPGASDPLGKPLSFSVRNKPAWAAFSIATGRLYGTPNSGQTGTYNGVSIVASNANYSAVLPAFSVTVTNGATSSTTTGAATGSAKLVWVLPKESTNGTALHDLAGVRIYYGTTQSNLTHSVQVSSTSTTSYTISRLAAGTWYFGIRAYTTTGAVSALSRIVGAKIP
jgi:Putative Ig domain